MVDCEQVVVQVMCGWCGVWCQWMCCLFCCVYQYFQCVGFVVELDYVVFVDFGQWVIVCCFWGYMDGCWDFV